MTEPIAASGILASTCRAATQDCNALQSSMKTPITAKEPKMAKRKIGLLLRLELAS